MKPIWTMIFKSAWWENIQLSTAHRHEVVHVGSESGSAMPCPCYRGVPDLNMLIPLCLRHHYALPACLTIKFHREDRREILNMFKISRRSEEMPAPTRSHNDVFTMPPIANDTCTLSPIYPDLLDRDRSGPDRHSGIRALESPVFRFLNCQIPVLRCSRLQILWSLVF